MAGPPIDGYAYLQQVIQDLQQRVRALENRNGRNISIGTNYRIQAVGSGVTEVLQAVRTADNNIVQIAP